MIIGITGNSGTGKTAICKAILESSNMKTVSILDADKIAKELSKPGQEYFKEIVNMFGKNILTEEGILDRNVLANIIFNDSKKREELNKITYKYIGEETKRRIKITKSELIIIDAPLLIESSLNKICNFVISVLADEKKKIERICLRDKQTEEIARTRLSAQQNDEFYINNSNYVIINNNQNLEIVAKDILEYIESIENNNEIVIIQDGNAKILQFKKLLEYKKIKHCYTLKPLDFASNNTYEEKQGEVKKNCISLCNLLNIDYKNIVRAYQTHTTNVAYIENETGIFPKHLINVDGMITDKKDKALSLVFADCTPIFLFDKSKNIIANIHSGWQGTLNKIVVEALNRMRELFKSNSKDIICAIGPTIRKCHFEVEEDVKNRFVENFKSICKKEDFVTHKDDGKYLIDTVFLNKKMLLNYGILEENIIDSNICTVCSNKLFHSYRAEKEKSGRSTSLICKIK